jgi:hypothetical protein
MNKELINYVNDTENDECNFNLAAWYENQGHLSPACSYYLRCAELTKNNSLAYECLLKLYVCYKQLSNRDYTCENLLKSALNLFPQRPEAYFLLSQFYEHKSNWMDSYLYASLGLELSSCEPSNLGNNFGYESKYMLLFQKAVASWWYGKPKEARMLFRRLKDDYGDKLNEYYFKLIETNLITLGSGPDWESSIRYNKSDYDLRFRFAGCDEVEKNFSQACQDLFVLAALNGKKNGTYLEIGSAHSYHNSNTALLEQFGWTGVGLEMNPELASMHTRERKNKVLCENALKTNYEKLLKDNFSENIIDYLQLDIEPSSNTFEALLLIPFDKYKFRLITYEHDHYVDMTRSYRDKSRRYLRNMGYTLLFNDIAPNDGCSFEDWWIKEDLIDPAVLQNLNSYPKGEINLAKELMVKKKIKNKLQGIEPVNFVSIEESIDRRDNLQSQFEKYEIKNLVPHIFKRYHEYDHKLNGQFVCDLHENSKGPVTSHIKAIKNWYDSTNDEYAFFCEDDLSLEPVNYWNFTWKEFVESLPSDWECVQLTWVRSCRVDVQLRERLTDDWNAAAYLIKRDYAKKIIDNYYVDGKEFNLEIKNTNLIPIVENILFNSIGKVYNIPIFAEDVKNVKSTYFGKDPTEVCGQGEYHWDSYNWVIDWWKNKGQYLGLKNIVQIPHIYKEPQFGEDWFTYPSLYKSMVKRFPSGSKFVEIGSWKGKSSAFMAVEIANSHKNIEFYCVDTWEGSVEHKGIDNIDLLYYQFILNMKPLEKYYKSIRSRSLKAAEQFENESLDFVFIDASHEYEDVKKDIQTWLPKIKKGGVLAGHDYYLGYDYFPGVKKAVNECLSNLEVYDDCFIFHVK